MDRALYIALSNSVSLYFCIDYPHYSSKKPRLKFFQRWSFAFYFYKKCLGPYAYVNDGHILLKIQKAFQEAEHLLSLGTLRLSRRALSCPKSYAGNSKIFLYTFPFSFCSDHAICLSIFSCLLHTCSSDLLA